MRTAYRDALLVATALATVATACGDSKATDDAEPSENAAQENVGVQEEDGPGVPGGRINYGLRAESDGWNPGSSRWSPDGLMVSRAIFDTLATYDADGNWQPYLAESFTPNEDYTQWVVRVREGVTFHNGTPLDGAAVAANMQYHIDSPLTNRPFEPLESVVVDPDDPMQVIVTADDPWVNWPYAMATQVGTIAEPEWLASGDTRNPIGTGPFVFESWEPDRELVVTKNPDYWQEGYPYLDEVVFQPITDPTSRATGLVSGDLDAALLGAVEAADLQGRADAGELQLFNDTSGESNEVFVQLNVSAPPFDNPLARQALAEATDRQNFIDVMQDGLYEPAAGPFPESSKWYAPSEYPDYDLEAARATVAEYEAETGQPLSFEILVAPDATTGQSVDFLIEQWADAGIEAKPAGIQQAEGILKVLTGDYQSIYWQQFDSPHPLGDSVWWHPESVAEEGGFSLNFARNVNPTIGDALDQARQAQTFEEEKELYATVQEELGKDKPYIWLYHGQIRVGAREGLVNVTYWFTPGGEQGLPLQGGSHPLWQIWLQEPEDG